MNNLKKNLIGFGAIVVAMLIISTVTAVGQVESKPVMDKIAQQESLSSLFEEIVNVAKLNNQNLDISSQQQIEQFLQSVNSSEFLNCTKNIDFLGIITSDWFINLMNNHEIYNVITGNDFSTLYNTNEVQNFVNNQIFMDFFNSDDCQYVLDHLNIGNGGMQISSQNSNMVLSSQQKTMTVNTQQASQTQQTTTMGKSTQLTSTSSQQTVQATAQTQGQINAIGGTINNPQPAAGEIFLAFVVLVAAFIVGIITWIFSPLVALWFTMDIWAIFVLFIFQLTGGIWMFPAVAALLTVLFEAGMVLLWPLVCVIYVLIMGG